MTTYRGLTWDHPRGYDPLAAAALARPGPDGRPLIRWERQPLEGFESTPVAELAERYDLLVIDHPHLGETLRADCLVPMDEIFEADRLAAFEATSIGATFASYRLGGNVWALPLDAATQVMALRPDLLGDREAPATWDDVVRLSAEVPVALSLAGPHAMMCFYSICVALGEPAASRAPRSLVSGEAGEAALALLARLYAASVKTTLDDNPIAILEKMATGAEIACCPLIYGYVPYARRGLRFVNAPCATPGGRLGTTLGGTGLAVTRRAGITDALRGHLEFLMSADYQVALAPRHNGQPSARAAWTDAEVDRVWNGFYRGTAASLEAAWVRPRHAGTVAFQNVGARIVRDGLAAGSSPRALLGELERRFAASFT